MGLCKDTWLEGLDTLCKNLLDVNAPYQTILSHVQWQINDLNLPRVGLEVSGLVRSRTFCAELVRILWVAVELTARDLDVR